jgi:ATP-binding protein involved in chromosome partitioning
MLLKIAIPVVDGRLLGHLGEARQFALVEVNPQTRTVVRSQVIEAPPHEPGSFPRWLREQGVQVAIAADIGQRALDNLNHHDIEVRIGRAGASAKSLVTGWLAGQFSQMPKGCAQQHGEMTGHECQLSDYLKN